MSAATAISSTPAAAKEYTQAGLVLVPIDRNSKGPRTKGWNLRGNCVDDESGAARLTQNIGLALAYSRMVVVDIDDLNKAVKWFAKSGIDLLGYWGAPDAVRWTSGLEGRGKLLYRLPPGVAPLLTRMFKVDGVELRCATATGRTVQDVLPPSIHPKTGRPYRWLGPGTFREIPQIPADLLVLWRSLTARNENAAPHTPLGVGRDDLETLLAKINPEELPYDDWLHVGMALHHETRADQVGLDIWDSWSIGDGKNPLYKGREELISKWTSFHVDAENPRTLRTIERMVEDRADLSLEWTPIANEVTAAGDVIDFTVLARTPPAPRRWVRNAWIPRAKLKLMAGAGGIGKSLLEQQLQTCIANGLDWLGIPGIQGPTLGFYCEDDTDELMRRQAQIFAAYGLDPAMHSAGVNIQSRVGKNNLLFAFDKHRLIPTAFYHEMHAMLSRIRPVLLVLDNSAQMYNGSELDRPMVTAFCNKLSGLALEFDMAISLASHPAKVEGSEFSGSTAWDAAVRTRLYLQRNKDNDTVTLKKAKANYARLEELDLEYRDGIFAPRTLADASHDVTSAEPVILAALEHFTRIQTNTSQKPKAQNNLLKLADHAGLLNGTSMNHATRALARMIASGEIRQNVTMPWRGQDRHRPIGLATAAAAEIAAAVEAAKVAAKGG